MPGRGGCLQDFGKNTFSVLFGALSVSENVPGSMYMRLSDQINQIVFVRCESYFSTRITHLLIPFPVTCKNSYRSVSCITEESFSCHVAEKKSAAMSLNIIVNIVLKHYCLFFEHSAHDKNYG